MQASVKSNKVEQYVRQRIVTGDWPAGSKVPSDNELCQQLDVSYMTVKTVLSRLASEGLLTRKRRLGTRVSDGVTCGNIAVVVRAETLYSPVGYYYRSVLQCIRNHIETNGYRCVLAVGHGQTDDEFIDSIRLFDQPIIKQTLGLVCFDDSSVSIPILCKKNDIPVVYLTAAVPLENEHCVVLDYRQMLEMGLALLQEKELENYFLLHVESPPGQINLAHYTGLKKMIHSIPGLPENKIICLPWGGYDYEGLYKGFRQWWDSLNEKPQALFFMDDAVCDVALRVIVELGINVPDDLAILTQANINRNFHFPVPLTSLAFNPTNAVDTAWQLLKDIIQNKDIATDKKHITIPATLSPGSSL